MPKRVEVKCKDVDVGFVVVDDENNIITQGIDHRKMSEEDQTRFFRDGLEAYVYKEEPGIFVLWFKPDPEPEKKDV